MLRLLLVDDSQADRILITRELKRELLDTEVEWIVDLASLEQALDNGSFDLVITDYCLHWTDGLTVLRAVKSRHPDCPVVMCTDSGNQEIAVEAMKSGLNDYLLKSSKDFARLPGVVRSTLQQVQHVTERKQSEAALQQSEARLKLALDASQMGIWDWDIQANQVTWTESNERLFGFAPGAFPGTYAAFIQCIHPDDRSSVVQTVARSLKQKTAYSHEYRIIRPDGSIRWLAGKGELVCDPANQPVRMLGTTIDITERKQTELALQQLNNTLEQQVRERTARLRQARSFDATLKRITDKVRDSLDEAQILQTAVEELALATGVKVCNVGIYDLEQATSTVQYEYTMSQPPLQSQVFRMADFSEGYDQLLRGQYFQHCPLTFNPQHPSVAQLSCPIKNEQGVLGDLWLIHDADYSFDDQDIRLVQQVANQCAIALQQAKLYQAAQTQVQELEKLNRLKDDFLSTVSHELRTPIANMKMAIQMLKLASTEERRQRYLEILQAECDRESELVNDLLDLQRLEDSLSTKEVVDDALQLTEWLPGITQSFQTRIQARQQILDVTIDPALPPLTIDRRRLERLLIELLNNACKYTPADGNLLFSACYEASSSPNADAAVVFTIGNQAEISPTEIPHIFEKFYRVPNADPWRQGGTGLGLALVQKLVEQLNGTIHVESNQGWTLFTISLPVSCDRRF